MRSSVFADARQRPTAVPFLPPSDRHVLASGLEVWVVEEATVPLVALVWSTPWGAAHDPLGLEGRAVLASQLLGTAPRSDLAAVGVDLFPRCDWDCSSVALELLSEDLETGLAGLCEVAQALRFSSEALARWRRWQTAELAKRCRQASAVADDTLAQELYGTARYGLPLLGTEDGLRRLERSHVEEVHRCGSDPRCARLIAVGCVDGRALLRRLDELVDPKAFGGSAPPRTVAPSARPYVRRVVVVDAPGAPRTELRLGWIGVRRTDGDFARLNLLNTILGGPSWSRLGRNLRERRGDVYGVWSRLEERAGPAPFVIGTTTGHAAAGIVVREILDEIDRLQSEPVPADELRGAQDHLEERRATELQTCHGRARQLRNLAAHGLSEADVARELGERRSLGPEDLAALARRFLDLRCITLVAVGPAARLRARLAPFGEVSVLAESPMTKM